MKTRQTLKPLALACIFSLLPVSLAVADDFAQTLQATLQNNPAIKGKKAELQAQGYALDTAEARRYPTLSAEINTVADGYDQGIARVDQPIWTFGKIDTGIELEQAGISSEELSLLSIQRQLMDKTAVAYSRIQGLRQQISVTAENIVQHQDLLDHISRRQQGQMASDADVTLGKSRLVLAKSRQQRLKGELVKAETELKSLTIEPVSTTDAIPAGLLQLPPTETVVATVTDRSAEVLYKQALSEEARIRVTNERVSSLPDVYVRAEYDFMDEPINGGDDARIGLVVTGDMEGLGLIAAGRTKGAESRYQAAKEDVIVTRNELQRQVDALLSDQRVFGDLIVAQREAVTAIEETMASYLRLYKSGRKPWLDVLNTQRELTEQRLQLVQLESDLEQTQLKIAVLIGQLDSIVNL